MNATVPLNIKLGNPKSVFFYKFPPWLNLVAHELGKQVIGFAGVFNPDPEHGPFFRVHGCFPELIRVHLSQTFIALNAEQFMAQFRQGGQKFNRSPDTALFLLALFF